jgi:hypothetical protein
MRLGPIALLVARFQPARTEKSDVCPLLASVSAFHDPAPRFVADCNEPSPCAREPRQREQFWLHDDEQPFRDKQTDCIGKHHHYAARDPVPLAGNENGCDLQGLDDRQRHRQNEKGRIGRKPFDLPPQGPQTLFGICRRPLHSETTRRIRNRS